MPSEAAKAVAQDVMKAVRNGQIPNKQKIQRAHGYSIESARAMKATKTKAYQEAVAPLVERLEAERDRAIALMPKKIVTAKYRDLVDSTDKLTKNIQLLTGGSTANVAIGIKKLNDAELQHLAEGGTG